MLIVIAGATGNIGANLVRSALRRGHQVRALGRTPSKIPADLRERLECFVVCKGYDDIPALDVACKGADAVIVAYAGQHVLTLDGQLLLLRAAERAGIKRFHAASWNLDWSQMPMGVHESYDPLISLANQARLTSPIKPIYVFCGGLARVIFGAPAAGPFEGDHALWVRKENGERTLNVVGDGQTKMAYAVESDVADFSVAVITAPGAEKGGYYCFSSGDFTFQELGAIYEKVRGSKCFLSHVMDVDTCKQLRDKKRLEIAETDDLPDRWQEITGLNYGIFLAEGTWNPNPVDAASFPDVPRTSIETFIRTNDWV